MRELTTTFMADDRKIDVLLNAFVIFALVLAGLVTLTSPQDLEQSIPPDVSYTTRYVAPLKAEQIPLATELLPIIGGSAENNIEGQIRQSNADLRGSSANVIQSSVNSNSTSGSSQAVSAAVPLRPSGVLYPVKSVVSQPISLVNKLLTSSR